MMFMFKSYCSAAKPEARQIGQRRVHQARLSGEPMRIDITGSGPACLPYLFGVLG
jgi:hypothetical protein